MRRPVPLILVGLALTAGALLRVGAQDGGPPSRPASSRSPDRGATSYAPVAIEEKFPEIFRRLSAEKPQVMKRAQQELEARYDLLLLVLLPVSLTMALLWKTKEVILDSVFHRHD